MSIIGYQYILVIYDYDYNAIISEPLKSRLKGEILNGYRNIHKLLNRNGYNPQLQNLDNEASDILIEYTNKNKIYLQLPPPYCHLINLDECDIHTFKEHFKALRTACDPHFSRNLWCGLLPQDTLKLNLIQTSRLHHQLSSYYALYGAFNYNQTNLASWHSCPNSLKSGSTYHLG